MAKVNEMEIIIIIIAIIGTTILLKKPKIEQNTATETKTEIPTETLEERIKREAEEEKEFIRYAYAPKWMFTQNEKQAYYKINEIARKHNLVVFAKVRLLDLVTPNKNNAKYKSNLYRIQAKHVDFVLTKENLVAKYIIELDDGSHDTEDRQERDRFVDLVLTTSGYKVLRTRAINAEEIEKFITQQ